MMVPILGGFLLLVLVLFGIVLLIYWRGRVAHLACPRCAHSVQGLTEPRCTECGSSLGLGVVRPGSLRPTPRIWLGVTSLVLGVVLGFCAFGVLVESWNPILKATGLAYMKSTIDRDVEVGIDQSNRLEVKLDAITKPPTNNASAGKVEVVLTQNDSELASWKGSGALRRQPQDGVLIDGAQVVASLRDQVPVDSDSPFAPLLHNKADAEILATAIMSYAAPQGSVSGYWLDSRGKKIFDGGISSSSGGLVKMIWPSDIWWTPVYVIPIVIFLGFLLLGIRVLGLRRSLVPFEPEPTAA